METLPGLEQTTKKKKKNGFLPSLLTRATQMKIPPRHMGSLIWGRRSKGEQTSPRCPSTSPYLQTPPSRAGPLRFGVRTKMRAFSGVTRKQSCKSVLGWDQKERLHAIIWFAGQQAEARLPSPALVTWPALPYRRTHDFGPHDRGKTKAWVFNHCCSFVPE